METVGLIFLSSEELIWRHLKTWAKGYIQKEEKIMWEQAVIPIV